MQHTHRDLTDQEILAKYERQPFSKIWPMLRPYSALLLQAMFALILFNVIAVAMPWMLKIAIDRILPTGDYLLFAALAGGMLVIYGIRMVLRYISKYLNCYMGIRVIVDLRQKLFRHLQSLSLHFYEEYRTGKLISNVITDCSMVNGLLMSLSQLGEQFFQVIIIALLLFAINWKIAILVALTLPIHYWNFYFCRKLLHRDALMVQERVSELSAGLSETITGMKVVKSFAREHAEARNFFHTLRPLIGIRLRLSLDEVVLWNVFDAIAIVTYLGTICLGIPFVKSGEMTIGEFVAFYTYIGMILGPINAITGLTMGISSGMVGATRILKILNTIPEIKDPEHPRHLDKVTGDIEFRHVGFAYAGQHDLTISDFSLHIKPGQKIALVGPSGSGKSTIGNLLLRFYDVNSGSIRVDGVDIRRLGLESYRTHIGVVLQEPFLFSGTVRENIGYAKDDVTDEEIERVAAMANVTEFVEHLPDGFDTMIGENGASLSGGQKQRIAIARAILKNPEILLLDEATSALDTVSEYLVQEALDRLMKDKTTIIIAHRLSTVKNADLIVVLDRGRVIQQGTHAELMSQPGVYYDLYQNQRKMVRGK